MKSAPAIVTHDRVLRLIPSDFMFQLSKKEFDNLRSQIVISSSWGGRRTAPYVFTEQGVAGQTSRLPDGEMSTRVGIGLCTQLLTQMRRGPPIGWREFPMKTATIRDFRTRIAELLDGDEPVLITRHGKNAAVVYPLRDPEKLPMEIRRKLFLDMTADIAKQLRTRGANDEEIERDFAAYRKRRRR